MAKPTTHEEVLARIDRIVRKGQWYPCIAGGTGKPGVLLENITELDSSNKREPDCAGTEVKFCSRKSLLTLVHKEGMDGGLAVYQMLKLYGTDGDDRRSFRPTVRNGKSGSPFENRLENGTLTCGHQDGTGPSIVWNADNLYQTAKKKLDLTIVVYGESAIDQGVKYVRYAGYTVCKGFLAQDKFFVAILRGGIAIDIDASELYVKPQKGPRFKNHSPKIRIDHTELSTYWREVTHFDVLNPPLQTTWIPPLEVAHLVDSGAVKRAEKALRKEGLI